MRSAGHSKDQDRAALEEGGSGTRRMAVLWKNTKPALGDSAAIGERWRSDPGWLLENNGRDGGLLAYVPGERRLGL